jgi:oligoribonuclease (3'-5' exoribonuclease)
MIAIKLSNPVTYVRFVFLYLQEFIRKEMPNLLEHLHYRLVDVSTVKELARRWNPRVFESAPKKGMAHRYVY